MPWYCSSSSGLRLGRSGGAGRPGRGWARVQAPGARVLGELAVEVAPKPKQLLERPQDDVRARAGRAARRARPVADGQLLDSETEPARLDKKFGAEGGP